MTAKLILYVGFSLYNCREITALSRGSGKLGEFHFTKFVSTLCYYYHWYFFGGYVAITESGLQ